MKNIKAYLTDEEIKSAIKYLPNNAEKLLNSDDWSTFFDELNQIIIFDILDNNNEITAYGVEVQRYWDRLFIKYEDDVLSEEETE